jgi:transposase
MERVDPRRVVVLDEAAANTKMGRSHAWIQRGEELVDPRPMNWGKSLTMIGAIRLTGWVCLGTLWGAATYESFSRWFVLQLLPKLSAGDFVVLDNAKAHKDVRLVRVAKEHGVTIKYLPPYSPDFSPIEPAWAIVKKRIKAVAPRDANALRRVAHRARRRVSPRHCQAWFAHFGFRSRIK